MTQISFWVGEKEALSFLRALLGSSPPPSPYARVWDAMGCPLPPPSPSLPRESDAADVGRPI